MKSITTRLSAVCGPRFFFFFSSSLSLLVEHHLLLSPPGLSAALVLLHRGAFVRLLLRTGLVRQAWRCGIHQILDGEATSHLGPAEPAHLSQGPALCHDGPHRRGGI